VEAQNINVKIVEKFNPPGPKPDPDPDPDPDPKPKPDDTEIKGWEISNNLLKLHKYIYIYIILNFYKKKYCQYYY